MSFDTWFSASSTLALVSWVVLVLAPRPAWLLALLRHGVVAALSVLYVSLMARFFFGVEGGGYDSIAQVRALFMSDPVLVAGWVHYLAFDLLVGTWIAERADALGVSRWLQAPVLVLTFLFGPLGWLVFSAWQAAAVRRGPAAGAPA